MQSDNPTGSEDAGTPTPGSGRTRRAAGADSFADFWAPDPPCPRADGHPWWASGGRPRITAVSLALATALALTPVPSSLAGPGVLPPKEPKESLESLRDRAGKLSDEYNGELHDMEGVMEDAEKAEKRADKTRDQVEDAKDQVRKLAIASYTRGGVDPSLTLFVEDDPQDLIDQAQLVEHLSSANQEKIDELRQAIERDEKAQASAQKKVDAVKDDLEELEGRREEVQNLIADYPVQEMGGEYNITPRTEQMRSLVIEKFGKGEDVGGVGCYRPDGGWVVGEHPKGRACDFMVNGDGQMPSEKQIERGYAIAEWAQNNAKRLGIMYIIYRQKIWDIRRGGEGWRDMEDRGSITQNHFDHVHISMF